MADAVEYAPSIGVESATHAVCDLQRVRTVNAIANGAQIIHCFGTVCDTDTGA
jgi:hypothetical protein